jgi:hypothetical protein
MFGFLLADALTPIAELDSAGNIEATLATNVSVSAFGQL